MKKEAVKNKQKEVKPTMDVKRKPSKQVTVRKAGVAAVKKIAVDTELTPEQQSVDSAIVPLSSESAILQDSTEQIAGAAVKKSAKITKLPPEPQTADTNSTKHPTESKVLRERLGLNGYIINHVSGGPAPGA